MDYGIHVAGPLMAAGDDRICGTVVYVCSIGVFFYPKMEYSDPKCKCHRVILFGGNYYETKQF